MKIYRYPSKVAQKRIAAIVNRELGFKKKDLHEVNRILEDEGPKAALKWRADMLPPVAANEGDK